MAVGVEEGGEAQAFFPRWWEQEVSAFGEGEGGGFGGDCATEIEAI